MSHEPARDRPATRRGLRTAETGRAKLLLREDGDVDGRCGRRERTAGECCGSLPGQGDRGQEHRREAAGPGAHDLLAVAFFAAVFFAAVFLVVVFLAAVFFAAAFFAGALLVAFLAVFLAPLAGPR